MAVEAVTAAQAERAAGEPRVELERRTSARSLVATSAGAVTEVKAVVVEAEASAARVEEPEEAPHMGLFSVQA